MPESLLTGPIFYLLIAWRVVATIFLILLNWQSLLESHEHAQFFVDAAGARMAE